MYTVLVPTASTIKITEEHFIAASQRRNMPRGEICPSVMALNIFACNSMCLYATVLVRG